MLYASILVMLKLALVVIYIVMMLDPAVLNENGISISPNVTSVMRTATAHMTLYIIRIVEK